MSSLELGAGTDPHPAASPSTDPRSKAGVLVRLLDPAFGFFVWSIHFLAVYVGAAVACVLGLGAASPDTRSTFLAVLVAVTLAATAVLAGHGMLRHRRQRDAPDRRFRMLVAVGGDAVAAVAVVWQLFPILMVPVCA